MSNTRSSNKLSLEVMDKKQANLTQAPPENILLLFRSKQHGLINNANILFPANRLCHWNPQRDKETAATIMHNLPLA